MKTRIELNTHSVYDTMDSVISIKELVKFAKQNNMPTIALTDLNCVQGFPEFERECKKAGIKPIYGAQIIHGTHQEEYPFTSTVLVKNQTGLKNLYRIISELKDDGICKNVTIQIMEQYHEGLLFGAYKCDYDMANEKMIAFLDYVEIDDSYASQDEKKYNLDIMKDAKARGKLVVAVSRAKFIGEDGKLCWRILREGAGFETDGIENMYLRNTTEMLEEFSYLGEDAMDVVINNPLKIAEQIEEVQIIPNGYYNHIFDGASTAFGNAFKSIKIFAESFAANRYGEIYPQTTIPAEIEERLDTELNLNITKECADELVLARIIVREFGLRNGLFNTRGTAASSFLSYCLGITDINPLPPHYFCPECKRIEWVNDIYCGADLPDKACSCGGTMHGDGMNIPYESFFGFKGDKIPDIDINCDREAYDTVINAISSECLMGNPIAVAGTVRTVSGLRAPKMIADYEEKNGIHFNENQKEEITEKLTLVKQSDGVHPSGLFIMPKGKEIMDFTPVSEEKYHGLPITHFAFHDLHDTIYKFDILPVNHLGLLRELETETGVKAKDIPVTSPEIFTLIKNKDLSGITEFDTNFVSKILDLAKPEKFSDLVKIIGLSHGTGTWHENAEILFKNGVCAIRDIPATRDDIYHDLLSGGLEKEKAFRYSEAVRKGLIAKGRLSDEQIREFEEDLFIIGMPDWYADYCKRIRYLFPKAHACEFARITVIEAWYKVHFPKQFYDACLMVYGKE